MTIRMILVRHGETDWNREKRLQGRTNVPLNKKGIKQIEMVAAGIKKSGEEPWQIISSPLTRAIQSANIISGILEILFSINENLAERDFGVLEGKTWEEITEIYGPNFKEMDRKQQYDYRPFGGESVEEVGERIADFMDYAEKYRGKTIIVITHPGILRFMRFMFHGTGIRFSHRLKPSEFSILEL